MFVLVSFHLNLSLCIPLHLSVLNLSVVPNKIRFTLLYLKCSFPSLVLLHFSIVSCIICLSVSWNLMNQKQAMAVASGAVYCCFVSLQCALLFFIVYKMYWFFQNYQNVKVLSHLLTSFGWSKEVCFHTLRKLDLALSYPVQLFRRLPLFYTVLVLLQLSVQFSLLKLSYWQVDLIY